LLMEVFLWLLCGQLNFVLLHAQNLQPDLQQQALIRFDVQAMALLTATARVLQQAE
jgi:hypothetical protein